MVGAAALLVGVLGAAAFACTNLATLILSSPSGHPGDTINLIGASFVYPCANSGRTPTPVMIHWQSDSGPVLAETTPDRFPVDSRPPLPSPRTAPAGTPSWPPS